MKEKIQNYWHLLMVFMDVQTGQPRYQIPVNPNTTQNIIPTPLPAYSKKDVWGWFSDGTFTRPPDGFWKGGDLQRGQHVVWEGLKRGKNGGESAKTLLYHGVVCGLADSESVYVK